MASPTPTEPTSGNEPAIPRGRNTLAFRSFLLSLVFPAAVVLYVGLSFLLGFLLPNPADQAFQVVSEVSTWVFWTLLAVTLVTSISAIVMSIRALRLDPRLAGGGFALVAVLIAILDLLVICPCGVAGYIAPAFP